MNKIIFFLLGCVVISCNDKNEEVDPQIMVDFSYEIDSTDFLKVHFTNHTLNASSFFWDFGNGDSSNIENPTYTYASAGDYDVTLTVIGVNGVKVSKTRTITLYGVPESPLTKLCGNQSKIWKLYRIGSAVSLGPDPSQPDLWWEGFSNDGSRSCLYKHEFVFNIDSTFEFVDHNVFWGYHTVWPPEDPVYESCFEPSIDNMIVNNTDLSVWLSNIHSFEFLSCSDEIILRGNGAWIGFPFLGTSSNHGIDLPDSVAFTVSFEQMPSFDLMTVNFDHGEDGFWTFRYVNYENWQDEPQLIE